MLPSGNTPNVQYRRSRGQPLRAPQSAATAMLTRNQQIALELDDRPNISDSGSSFGNRNPSLNPQFKPRSYSYGSDASSAASSRRTSSRPEQQRPASRLRHYDTVEKLKGSIEDEDTPSREKFRKMRKDTPPPKIPLSNLTATSSASTSVDPLEIESTKMKLEAQEFENHIRSSPVRQPLSPPIVPTSFPVSPAASIGLSTRQTDSESDGVENDDQLMELLEEQSASWPVQFYRNVRRTLEILFYFALSIFKKLFAMLFAFRTLKTTGFLALSAAVIMTLTGPKTELTSHLYELTRGAPSQLSNRIPLNIPSDIVSSIFRKHFNEKKVGESIAWSGSFNDNHDQTPEEQQPEYANEGQNEKVFSSSDHGADPSATYGRSSETLKLPDETQDIANTHLSVMVSELQNEILNLKQQLEQSRDSALKKMQQPSDFMQGSIKDDISDLLLQSGIEQKTRPDFASIKLGARINHRLTKSSYDPIRQPRLQRFTSQFLSIFGRKTKLTTSENRSYMNEPEAALDANNEPGNCWVILGNQGDIAIHLASTVFLEEIGIDHMRYGESMNQNSSSSVLRKFQIWAYYKNPKDSSKIAKISSVQNAESRDKLDQAVSQPPAAGYILLDEFEYQIGEKNKTQKFQLSSYAKLKNENRPPHTENIVIRVLNNWGNPSLTTVYRVRAHGSVNAV